MSKGWYVSSLLCILYPSKSSVSFDIQQSTNYQLLTKTQISTFNRPFHSSEWDKGISIMQRSPKPRERERRRKSRSGSSPRAPGSGLLLGNLVIVTSGRRAGWLMHGFLFRDPGFGRCGRGEVIMDVLWEIGVG